MEYKLAKPTLNATVSNTVICLTTGITIPFDPANTDYQQYLAWCAEGNTPLPADEPATGA